MNASEAVRLIDRLTLPTAAQSRPGGIMRKAASDISRRTVHRARAELAMRALHLCLGMLYERDDAGELLNVDGETGRILCPLPWGRAGRSAWGLTGGEADALRRIVGVWKTLFWYDSGSRSWCLDLVKFPAEPAAHEFVEARAISVSEWRAAWASTQHKR